MFRDFTFGQYYPSNSFLHKMDARVKIILSTIYLVGIFFIQGFAVYGLTFLFLLMVVLVSKTPVKLVLKSVKPIAILLVLTSMLNLFFIKDGNILFSWWIFTVTDQGLLFAAKMVIRLLLLVMGASVLTLTTTPVQLSSAIESLLSPLIIIKFPAHEMAMVMSIALTFIPVLMESTDKIIRAQKSRGADFESGGLIKRAKAFVPILVPLFIGALRRAEELADAMDSRCYGVSKKRSKMKIMKTGWRDWLAVFVVVAFFTGVILCSVFATQWSALLPWLYF